MSEETTSENKDIEKVIGEMDILNPDKKEVYRVDSETLKLSEIDYRIIENYKEAFDLEQLENRYSNYLLKYDYIVGDIAYQKLRLRGFFENYRKGVPIDMKIANLEDYLVEYCSFGSPYFVLERVHKKEEDPESYFKKPKSSKRKGRSRRRSEVSSRKKNEQTDRNKATKKANHPKPSQSKPTHPKKKKSTKKFQLNKKQTENQKTSAQKTVKKSGNKSKQKTKTTKQFEIRKKTD